MTVVKGGGSTWSGAANREFLEEQAVDYREAVASEEPTNVTLDVPDAVVTVGVETAFSTRLSNSGAAVESASGRITVIEADELLAEDIELVMPDFNGPGYDLAVSFVKDGARLIGTYGDDGFPIFAGQNAVGENLLTVHKAGSWPAQTEILGGLHGDEVLACDTWQITAGEADGGDGGDGG